MFQFIGFLIVLWLGGCVIYGFFTAIGWRRLPAALMACLAAAALIVARGNASSGRPGHH